jgi:hypothetical protein
LKNNYFSTLILLSLSVLLISWGSTGHKKISEASALSFNQQMQDFNSWTVFLRDHSTDPDTRKNSDPTEGPKHYIDVDNYSIFISKGRIPQTLDSVNTLYGTAFVIGNGTLPWATKTSFDSLSSCMQRHDFGKAKIFAADLGHYVADGHMPMHITKNYDGAVTGNNGIHSRYESAMIGSYISQITYSGESITEISNVNQYIFDYLYTNYPYVDSVLVADNYAKSLSTDYKSTIYTNALWVKSKSFTIPLFKNASHAFAELIYTAWVQAGSPSLSAPASTPDLLSVSNAVLDQNMPNPFTSSAHINYTLKENTKVLMQVRDIKGTIIATIVDDNLPSGSHSYDWTPENLPAGLYYLVLNTGKYTQVKKMVYSGGN